MLADSSDDAGSSLEDLLCSNVHADDFTFA